MKLHIVKIEYCKNCSDNHPEIRHDEKKFNYYFQKLKQVIENDFKELKVQEIENHEKQPRIGSFEISFYGKTVFSKLNSGLWPIPYTICEKLNSLLIDFREYRISNNTNKKPRISPIRRNAFGDQTIDTQKTENIKRIKNRTLSPEEKSSMRIENSKMLENFCYVANGDSKTKARRPFSADHKQSLKFNKSKFLEESSFSSISNQNSVKKKYDPRMNDLKEAPIELEDFEEKNTKNKKRADKRPISADTVSQQLLEKFNKGMEPIGFSEQNTAIQNNASDNPRKNEINLYQIEFPIIKLSEIVIDKWSISKKKIIIENDEAYSIRIKILTDNPDIIGIKLPEESIKLDPNEAIKIPLRIRFTHEMKEENHIFILKEGFPWQKIAIQVQYTDEKQK